MKKIIAIVLVTFALAISQNALAAQAGFVLIAKGGAFATDEKGVQRALKRRSKIMEGDIISTDAKGMIQIRFVDKALLTLKANSKLDISAYQQAKEQGEDEEVVMNLITGGFRTITGSIGKGDKSAYKVKTPAASIGIRGTNYEVAQEVGGNYVMAVWDGGITVSNEQGSLDIGLDSDFIYVRVNATSEPQGLEEPPETFANSATPLPPEEEDKKDDSSDESKDENKDDSEKEGGSKDDKDSNKQNEETDEQAALDDADAESGTTEVADGSTEEDAKESQLEEELDEVEAEAGNITEETPLVEVEQVASNDTRFSDWEYSYLVQRPRAALFVDDDQAIMQNGLIVQDPDAGTDPVFVIAGQNPGTDNNLESFVLESSSMSDVDNQVSGSEFVSWGKWNGTLNILSTPNDTSSGFTEDHSFYWLSVEAASLSTLRGTASFDGETEFLGDIDGTAITTLNGQFDVNFDAGKIENGSLNFGHADQNWSMNFDGTVKGPNATMENIQGDITGTNACTECISGNIQGIFARPGDQFAGGFQLEGGSGTTAADGTTTPPGQANGLFSIKGEKN